MTDALRKAAQAVVDRWDSPLWKDQPHTAEFINALRAELAAPAPAQAMCKCGDRPAAQCDEEWGPKCDLGNNPAHARVYEAPHPAQAVPQWHELCRRLYVELFHCDKQMMSAKKYGKPIWQQGTSVRDVLADANEALAAHQPSAPAATVQG